MANSAHETILNQGVHAWNVWRYDNPELLPDLSSLDLRQRDLSKIDFSNTNLAGVNFSNAILTKANLRNANLSGSICAATKFIGVELSNANLSDADLSYANISKSNLVNTNFYFANLNQANLSKSNFYRFGLFRKKQSVINRIKCFILDMLLNIFITRDFDSKMIKFLNIDYSDLSNFHGTYFRGSNLSRTNLSYTIMSCTNLNSVDLSEANVTGITYNRFSRYQGIRADSCYGSQMFKRFAQDQDYIEEFRNKSWLCNDIYLLWLIFADCGRSLILWSGWVIFFILSFACIYLGLGKEMFPIQDGLKWSLDTMIYYSVITFSTLGFGDITPLHDTAKHIVIIEVITGYIMLGGLISIFSNKLARRS